MHPRESPAEPGTIPPVHVSAERFREVLGSWASGVTIVTSRSGSQVQGMTVSAFSSVSLEPPLILVCADRSAITHGIIAESGVFSVSLLARDQEALSNRFASKRDEWRRFDGIRCEDGATGCPRIPNALAWLDCEVTQGVEAGDHVVYIGHVIDAAVNAGDPLLYFRGSYSALRAR